MRFASLLVRGSRNVPTIRNFSTKVPNPVSKPNHTTAIKKAVESRPSQSLTFRVFSVGSDVVGTHPSMTKLSTLHSKVRSVLKSIADIEAMAKLASEAVSNVSITGLNRSAPRNTRIPGGARAHMLPVLRQFGIADHMLEAIHDFGQMLQTGRVSVTPRSQQNVLLGSSSSDYLRSKYSSVSYFFDMEPSEFNERSSEFQETLLCLIDEEISSSNSKEFTLTLPADFVNLYANWSLNSMYDSPFSERFRSAVLSRQEPTVVSKPGSVDFQAKLNMEITPYDQSLLGLFPTQMEDYLVKQREGRTNTQTYLNCQGELQSLIVGHDAEFGYSDSAKGTVGQVLSYLDQDRVRQKVIVISNEVILKDDGAHSGYHKLGLRLSNGETSFHIVENVEEVESQRQAILAQCPDLLPEPNGTQITVPMEGVLVSSLSDGEEITVTADEPVKVATIEAMKMQTSVYTDSNLEAGTYRVHNHVNLAAGDKVSPKCCLYFFRKNRLKIFHSIKKPRL